MTTLQAFLLGIVEGLTEFIPVSSTAHLLIVQRLLGILATDASFAFTVLVQLGAILSLIIFYWRDLLEIISAAIKGLLDRRPFEDPKARMGWYIVLASIPALLVGFLLRHAVEGMFKEPLLEAGIRLLVTTLALVVAELVVKGSRGLADLKLKDAIIVGLFQILAVFPGSSRSGATISGGMVSGLDRPAAARFAFLISAPVMLAAGVYQSWEVIKLPGTRAFLPIIILGFIAAAVVGWLALRWLVHYLNRHSLYLFAAYTAVLGVICLAVFFIR